jgi:hypothetical protein
LEDDSTNSLEEGNPSKQFFFSDLVFTYSPVFYCTQFHCGGGYKRMSKQGKQKKNITHKYF